MQLPVAVVYIGLYRHCVNEITLSLVSTNDQIAAFMSFELNQQLLTV